MFSTVSMRFSFDCQLIALSFNSLFLFKCFFLFGSSVLLRQFLDSTVSLSMYLKSFYIPTSSLSKRMPSLLGPSTPVVVGAGEMAFLLLAWRD
ncbi:hypothetical protein FGO68_gene16587 [Halteria grandinella]|uniref:Uncharacterized protein n=1 Tax=Halteria grandinella TaxID=5974 RepID=A0A8J8SXS0_HALGN|nr:hypothetical protein FGO68_gene16587 [Halteria grandinella]